MKQLFVLIFLPFMASCSLIAPDNQDIQSKMQIIEEYEGSTEEAIFAGGCFWCIEASFEHVDGVVAAISGFAGGQEQDPSYEAVASGATGHRESVLVVYDPDIVTFKQLVDYFWKQFDPTDDSGSFVDRGFQYSSAVFYLNEDQKNIAQQSKEALEESGVFDDPIVTPILPAGPFYPAESYHQDYYKENPIRYKYYRHGSGRDQFLEEVWGGKLGHFIHIESSTTITRNMFRGRPWPVAYAKLIRNNTRATAKLF